MAVAVVVNAGNELPVPGNPFIADRITRNVVHSALGQPVPDLPSMWRFYLMFDLVALLLLGAHRVGLLRAVRPSGARHRRGTECAGGLGSLVRALGVGLLVLAPTSSYGWAGLWTWAPDLAVVIAALAVLLAATAALRLIGLLQARARHPTCHSITTEEERGHVSA